MKIKAIILAGGRGSRLTPLTLKRAKPAVPFAGRYRIIDFTLSNCVNSNIFDILVLTQYRPHSLNDHIHNGRPWDLDRGFTGGVRMLHPFQGMKEQGWYAGTADAVAQNVNFVRQGDPDHVLILAGDHVYKMNYRKMLKAHEATQADVTLATIEVPRSDAGRYGIVTTDDNNRITNFIEKPDKPPNTTASMGIYLFNYAVLERLLLDAPDPRTAVNDFGRDILPNMVRAGKRVYAYPYEGYWVDVGTVHSYWKAHMDFLKTPPCLDLADRSWVVHTRSEKRPPVRISSGSRVSDSLLSDGTVIAADAVVERSVFSPGVQIGEGAVIRESILFSDVKVEPGAVLDHCIIDKQVVVGAGSRLGGPATSSEPSITIIGKATQIPPRTVIGRGCRVGSDIPIEKFHKYVDGLPDNFEMDIEGQDPHTKTW